MRVSATYSYQRGSRLARGLNLNPLVNGVRPDPRFSNVIDVVSDAASRLHQLQMDATLNPGALLPAFRGPLISWKRSTIFANYTLASLRNNTDGPFSIRRLARLRMSGDPRMMAERHRLSPAMASSLKCFRQETFAIGSI